MKYDDNGKNKILIRKHLRGKIIHYLFEFISTYLLHDSAFQILCDKSHILPGFFMFFPMKYDDSGKSKILIKEHLRVK